MNNGKKIVGSFVLGLILGAGLTATGIHYCFHHRFFGHALWMPHGEFNIKKRLEFLDKKLDLNADQKAKIENILESTVRKVKEMRMTMRPQFKQIRESVRSEIRAVLNPDQQIKYDKIIEDQEARRKESEKEMDEKN